MNRETRRKTGRMRKAMLSILVAGALATGGMMDFAAEAAQNIGDDLMIQGGGGGGGALVNYDGAGQYILVGYGAPDGSSSGGSDGGGGSNGGAGGLGGTSGGAESPWMSPATANTGGPGHVSSDQNGGNGGAGGNAIVTLTGDIILDSLTVAGGQNGSAGDNAGGTGGAGRRRHV